MFLTDLTNKDGFELIVLASLNRKTIINITPYGAALHSFIVNHNGTPANVIDYYENKEDASNNLTSKGFKSCKLAPFACRIKGGDYRFNGNDYRINKFSLGKNAIHGLIYDAVFVLKERSADETQVAVTLQYEYRGEEEGYPFYFDCIVTYQLKVGNELLIQTIIQNKDKVSIPVQDGWHPYFTLGKKVDELELLLKSTQQIVFDENMIPTGELIDYSAFNQFKKIGDFRFDDCFKLVETDPVCIVRDPENKIQVEVRPQLNYPWLQLYTPPHRQSIAIENLSAPPDAFNNKIDLKILQSGEQLTFTTSFKITCY